MKLEAFDRLLDLAKRQNITINGLLPSLIAGSGAGMVATRTLKSGEVLITVPLMALRSRDTVSKSISKKLPKDFSAHGLLATEILLDTAVDFQAWKAVFPTLEDLTAGMPILWPATLQTLLPASCQRQIEKQKQALEADWQVVKGVWEDVQWEDFRYAWLIVNTRGFYNNGRGMQKYTVRDRLALQPVVDLLNHAEEGCKVEFGPRGFMVVAQRVYEEKEEVVLSYGAHSNDFLLVEYGFVMDVNKWDDVCLDSVLEPLFSKGQRGLLEDRDFWGRWVVDRKTPGCYRTQVALRCLLLGKGRWERVLAGLDEAEDVQREVDGMIFAAVVKYLGVAMEVQEVLSEEEELPEGERTGTGEQRGLLRRRWRQIEDILREVERLLTGPKEVEV